MSKKKSSSGGDCFVVALRNVTNDQDLYLCHGIVTGQGPLKGVRFSHAWNETDSGYVIDQSNGNDVILTKDAYYRLGHIDEATVHRYNFEETAQHALETGTYGPWEEIYM